MLQHSGICVVRWARKLLFVEIAFADLYSEHHLEGVVGEAHVKTPQSLFIDLLTHPRTPPA